MLILEIKGNSLTIKLNSFRFHSLQCSYVHSASFYAWQAEWDSCKRYSNWITQKLFGSPAPGCCPKKKKKEINLAHPSAKVMLFYYFFSFSSKVHVSVKDFTSLKTLSVIFASLRSVRQSSSSLMRDEGFESLNLKSRCWCSATDPVIS